MKTKLILTIAISLFAMNSAFAKTAFSKKESFKLANISECYLAKGLLQKVSNSKQDLSVRTSCTENGKITVDWKVKYKFNPSQRFKITLKDYYNTTVRECNKYLNILSKMESRFISYNAGCNEVMYFGDNTGTKMPGTALVGKVKILKN